MCRVVCRLSLYRVKEYLPTSHQMQGIARLLQLTIDEVGFASWGYGFHHDAEALAPAYVPCRSAGRYQQLQVCCMIEQF